MLVEHVLDASEMEHPIPFEKSTAICVEMKPGEYYRMLHRRIPYPLFDFIKHLSLNYVVTQGQKTAYEIIIFFPEDLEELQRCGVLKKGMNLEFNR